jgi:hypothetical protein
MAEQGSDSAKTEASGAELVHQRLDQSTRLARARQAGLLAAGGAVPLAIVVGTLGAALSLVPRPLAVRRARDVRCLRAMTCQPWAEEVRQ